MLVNCVVYRDGEKLADIPVADISDYMGQPGCFVWVALQDATDEELSCRVRTEGDAKVDWRSVVDRPHAVARQIRAHRA